MNIYHFILVASIPILTACDNGLKEKFKVALDCPTISQKNNPPCFQMKYTIVNIKVEQCRGENPSYCNSTFTYKLQEPKFTHLSEFDNNVIFRINKPIGDTDQEHLGYADYGDRIEIVLFSPDSRNGYSVKAAKDYYEKFSITAPNLIFYTGTEVEKDEIRRLYKDWLAKKMQVRTPYCHDGTVLMSEQQGWVCNKENSLFKEFDTVRDQLTQGGISLE